MVPAHIQHTFNGKDIIAMRDEGVVINNAQEFLQAIQNASFIKNYSRAYVHGLSTAAKWSKKLGLKPRLWAGG